MEFILFKTFFKFIYFISERERVVCVSEAGAEREGLRESQAGFALSVLETDLGLDPTNLEIMP